jgi:hypothetical protein
VSYPIDETERVSPPRRLPCFTISNLAAAGALGFLVGAALASTFAANHIPQNDQRSSGISQEARDAGSRQ